MNYLIFRLDPAMYSKWEAHRKHMEAVAAQIAKYNFGLGEMSCTIEYFINDLASNFKSMGSNLEFRPMENPTGWVLGSMKHSAGNKFEVYGLIHLAQPEAVTIGRLESSGALPSTNTQSSDTNVLLMNRPFVLELAATSESLQEKDIDLGMELFTAREGVLIKRFCQWLYDNERTIGYGNYDQAVYDFVEAEATEKALQDAADSHHAKVR